MKSKHPYREQEAECNEEHIYNVIDGELAYEVVMKKDSGDKKPQVSAAKAKNEIDLKPCPAYAPVTAQGTGVAEADTPYETVSSM